MIRIAIAACFIAVGICLLVRAWRHDTRQPKPPALDHPAAPDHPPARPDPLAADHPAPVNTQPLAVAAPDHPVVPDHPVAPPKPAIDEHERRELLARARLPLWTIMQAYERDTTMTTIADIPHDALPEPKLREQLTILEASGLPLAPTKEGDVWYIIYGIARIPLAVVVNEWQRRKQA